MRALASVGSSAGFHELGIAMQDHMARRFGAQAGELVACLQCERELAACSSRTRRMYAGETHESRLLGDDIPGAPSGNKPATFQYELAVPANTVVNFDRFAITLGMLPTVYARFNQKVAWANGNPTFDVSFTSLPASLPAQPTAGTWYLQGMLRDPGVGTRRYGLRAQFSGGSPRPAAPAGACALGSGVGSCTCVPACTGRTCGADGCGGSCGACPGGMMCNAAGTCACVPQCAGRGCGPDGCGGTCGTCASGTCNTANGMCEGCTPMCTGKVCGPNGCGQACGQCTGNNVVCELSSGQCVDAGELPMPDAGGGTGGGSGAGGGGEDLVMGGCGCGAAPSLGVLGLAALLMLRRRRAIPA
ncbi:MAG: hypothetical protein JNK82_13815 [Myxococcaceae bacterium]|nr:hypothetical protein [Myxococcaceae bacterium]